MGEYANIHPLFIIENAKAVISLRLEKTANMRFPFEKEIYDKAFWVSIGLAIIGWVVIYLIWGEYTTADIIGMLFTVPILAYLIHVILLFNQK
ncbi:MAG: hypothetical protein IPL98_12155 [Saprospiraceae bacterium]|jgi:hypothetical protein|nr:hypothetical protein [Saprospiraceae bacterium]